MTTQVTLASRAPGPLHELTGRRRGLTIDAYPLGPLLLLRCFGDVDGVEESAELRETGSEILHHNRARNEATLLLGGGEETENVLSLLTAQDAHLLPPIRWQGGEARMSLVLEDGADPTDLISQFPETRLVSKRTDSQTNRARHSLSSSLFLPKMTEKQARALLAAVDAGYYDFPRRVTTEQVSQSLGIARSTFEQHLNRAEHHVTQAMLPMVRMRAGHPAGEALEVYSKFSRELGLYVRLELLGEKVAGVRFVRKPSSDRERSDHPYLERILEQIRTGRGDLRDIPLHLEVGPFERRVLEFLRTVPAGETITYGEIARKLGHPNACRAVGTACARNPALVIVPCHRVVPRSGGLGGYSGEGGPSTKRKLLEQEGAALETEGTSSRIHVDPDSPRKPMSRVRG
jgi:O-6-methylguanine DNA methyltransferase